MLNLVRSGARSVLRAASTRTSATAAITQVSSRSLSSLADKTDDEVIRAVEEGIVNVDRLEKVLEDDLARAVRIRRAVVEKQSAVSLDNIPHENYNYHDVYGVCCERVVGYVPIPLGVVGPVDIDGTKVNVPMATTEGALVASTNRGCKAVTVSGGIQTVVHASSMTRAPVVRFPTAMEAAALKTWIEDPANFKNIVEAFKSTTRFGKLLEIQTALAGRQAFIRFVCDTGDAMGMNMVSKGVDAALTYMHSQFENMELLSISGNYCTDKKPAAVNWIQGRGKSVIAEAVLSADVVKKVLKTEVEKIVEVNTAKNLVGSAMAGSIGGFNAHASNIVTAAYIAMGQDPAQNVESSQCITQMESWDNGNQLHVSVTMPCIEVGSVGGGTSLPAQAACLDLIGARGPSAVRPGDNAEKVARIIAATVLCGELSLTAALSSGDLLSAHMKLNRAATIGSISQ